MADSLNMMSNMSSIFDEDLAFTLWSGDDFASRLSSKQGSQDCSQSLRAHPLYQRLLQAAELNSEEGLTDEQKRTRTPRTFLSAISVQGGIDLETTKSADKYVRQAILYLDNNTREQQLLNVETRVDGSVFLETRKILILSLLMLRTCTFCGSCHLLVWHACRPAVVYS